jgi:hypothetical protein
MDTYTVETDGIGGIVVTVAGPDGKVRLTSPSLATWTQAQDWTAEDRRSAERAATPH